MKVEIFGQRNPAPECTREWKEKINALIDYFNRNLCKKDHISRQMSAAQTKREKLCT